MIYKSYTGWGHTVAGLRVMACGFDRSALYGIIDAALAGLYQYRSNLVRTL